MGWGGWIIHCDVSQVALLASHHTPHTRYWSFGRALTTHPVWSHLVWCGPHKFCIQTRDPQDSGGRGRVLLRSVSTCLPNRSRRTDSLACQVSRNTRATFGLTKKLVPGGIGMQSSKVRPNRIEAGDMPVVGSGELRYCRRPATILSSSRAPSTLVLHCSNCFMDLTAASALLLLSGLYADDKRWDTPHR